jgi:hypothetical protein
LKFIFLDENVCINQNFTNPTRIATLQQIVNEKCHFEETKATTNVIDARFLNKKLPSFLHFQTHQI